MTSPPAQNALSPAPFMITIFVFGSLSHSLKKPYEIHMQRNHSKRASLLLLMGTAFVFEIDKCSGYTG